MPEQKQLNVKYAFERIYTTRTHERDGRPM